MKCACIAIAKKSRPIFPCFVYPARKLRVTTFPRSPPPPSIQLVASLLSLLVLVAIAIWALHDAIVALATAAESGADAGPGTLIAETARGQPSGSAIMLTALAVCAYAYVCPFLPSGTVNPNIVLAFGIVGIIFDIVALVAFLVPDRFWRRTEIDEQNEVVRISTDELSVS